MQGAGQEEGPGKMDVNGTGIRRVMFKSVSLSDEFPAAQENQEPVPQVVTMNDQNEKQLAAQPDPAPVPLKERSPSPEFAEPSFCASLNLSTLSRVSGKEESPDASFAETPVVASANQSLNATPSKAVTGSARKKLTTEEKLKRQKEQEEKRKQREEENLAKIAKKQEAARQREEQRKVKEAAEAEKAKAREEERKRRDEKKAEEQKKKDEREAERKQREEEKKRKEDEKNEQRRKREEERKRKLEEDEAAEKAKDEMQKKRIKEETRQRSLMESFFKVVPKAKPVHLPSSGDIGLFKPFEIQQGVFFPPYYGCVSLSAKSCEQLRRFLENGSVAPSGLYLTELKLKRHAPRTFPATCARKVGKQTKEIIIDDEDEMECSLAQSAETVKLIQFTENARPPYYGTMRKRSKKIRGRNPFGKDSEIEYEIDSDEEWEEEQAAMKEGEVDELSENDEEEEEMSEDEEEDDGFFVEDAAENENDVEGGPVKKVRATVGRWLAKKTLKRAPKRYAFGPYWAHQEASCPDSLKKLAVIPLAQDFEEVIEKATTHEDMGDSVNKIPLLMMPFLVKLIHGSVAKKEAIAKAFLNLWEIKENPEDMASFADLGSSLLNVVQSTERPRDLTKSLLVNVIGSLASWTRPPAAEKHRKRCHYVAEKVRVLYKVMEGACLPNPACCKTGAEKRKIDKISAPSPEIPLKLEQVDSSAKKQAKIDTPTKKPKTLECFWKAESRQIETDVVVVE